MICDNNTCTFIQPVEQYGVNVSMQFASYQSHYLIKSDTCIS